MTDSQSRIMRGQETITLAGERLIYTVRRSRRAKHLLLQVDGNGQVEVVMPWWVPAHQAASLVRSKQRWLRRQRTKRVVPPPRLPWHDGSQLPYLDEQLILRLRRDPKRQRATVVRQGQVLYVTLPDRGSVREVLEAWYARQARIFFTRAAQALADHLGVTVERVSIGNHKTQWGSCGPMGQLSFNWRLLLGPKWVAQYVSVHEVAHLVHHNHSSRYWAVVEKLYPDHRQARRWLRQQAEELRWG